jgi:hypothetical protein
MWDDHEHAVPRDDRPVLPAKTTRISSPQTKSESRSLKSSRNHLLDNKGIRDRGIH